MKEVTSSEREKLLQRYRARLESLDIERVELIDLIERLSGKRLVGRPGKAKSEETLKSRQLQGRYASTLKVYGKDNHIRRLSAQRVQREQGRQAAIDMMIAEMSKPDWRAGVVDIEDDQQHTQDQGCWCGGGCDSLNY